MIISSGIAPLHRSASILLVILTMAFGHVQAQNPQDKYAASLAALVESYCQNGEFQGAVMIAMDGEVVLKTACGYANVEWGISNTVDTKYTIASLGKAFTAVMILQLAEEGKLDLQDPVQKHLSTFREREHEVTLHHLLSHTSGIPWRDWGHKEGYDFEDLVDHANDGDLLFEPGAKFNYSNAGYNLLGAVIQQISGNSFEEELHRRILVPCGMSNSGLVKPRPILKKNASGYDRLPGGSLMNADWQDQSYAWGAGGMYATVEDMYKWDQALYGDLLLNEKSRELMFTENVKGVGYGWNIGGYGKANDGGTGTMVSGFGGTLGFASFIARLLDDRYFIVALGNINQVPQGNMENDLWNTLLGFEVEPVYLVSDSIYHIAFDQGVDAAALAYQNLVADGKKDQLPSEGGINRAGYALLGADGRSQDAIVLFKLNIALFPGSANVYDSLGEAYMVGGDNEMAITFYEKALELDPEMPSAINALEQLQGH